MPIPSPPFRIQCLEIAGDDARAFAQAQFSGDVAALRPGHWQWNAWLTPQGRVHALFHLAEAGDGRLLAVLRGGDCHALATALARYRLRRAVTIVARTLVARPAGPLAEGEFRVEHHAQLFGQGDRSLRVCATDDPGHADATPPAEWRRGDIARGWPRLPPGEPVFLPPALGLGRLGAVSLDKGCYPGQEIVARLHYRGGHKLRLFHLRGPEWPQAQGGPSTPWQCLDAVERPGGADVLAVGPLNSRLDINILGSQFAVVSIFDP